MKYDTMCAQIEALAESSGNYIPLLSNASALLYENMNDLNWAGFYLVKDEELLLGPFQGKVACVRIAKGKGVCGTAYEKDQTQRVEDVHRFPGHIACDSASNSEIVVPLRIDGEIVGVLDIDSPWPGRFTEEDQTGLEAVAEIIAQMLTRC
jgi:GAF domain-containing protein